MQAVSEVTGNNVHIASYEDFKCFIPILIHSERKECKDLIKEIPTNIYQDKINSFYFYLFPKEQPVIPPELGEYRLVILWRHLRKLMASLYSKKWSVYVYMNPHLLRELEKMLEELDVDVSEKYEEYLNMIEETVSENIGWPNDYPDVAHYLRVIFKPPRVKNLYIEVRYASTLCSSVELLDTEYFTQFLELLLKSLE